MAVAPFVHAGGDGKVQGDGAVATVRGLPRPRVVATFGVGGAVPLVTVAGRFRYLCCNALIDGEMQRDDTVAAGSGLPRPCVVAAFGAGDALPLVAVAFHHRDFGAAGIVDGHIDGGGAVAAVLVGADDRVGAGSTCSEGGIGGAVVPEIGGRAVGRERGGFTAAQLRIAADVEHGQLIDRYRSGGGVAAPFRADARNGVDAKRADGVHSPAHPVAPLVSGGSVGHQRGGITLTHSRVAADGDVRQRVYGNVGGGRGGTALRIGGRNRVGAGFRYGDTVALSHRAPLVRSAARGHQRGGFALTDGGIAADSDNRQISHGQR